MAARLDHVEIASLLIAHGSDPSTQDDNVRTGIWGVDSSTPTQYAERWLFHHVQHVVSSQPAHMGMTVTAQQLSEVFAAGPYTTALCCTVQLCESREFPDLSQHGRQRTRQSGQSQISNTCSEQIRALMKYTVHIHSSSCTHALQGLSPVHLAVQRNAYASIEVLLSRGADVNIQDHRVWAFSSFHACAQCLKSKTCRQEQ